MIFKYLQELAKHTVGAFSTASLVLAFAAVFLFPLSNVVSAIILTSAAFLSVLVAGFFVWRDAIENCPTIANLSIEYKSCIFHSSRTKAGVPISPMQFRIKLDAINRGQEPAVLTDIKIVKFNMNNRLLENQPNKSELLLLNTPHGNTQINCPYRIEGGKHIPNIEYRITVEIQVVEPVEFAKNLGEFQNYEIELEYSFEDMTRETTTRTISIQESFKEYRKQRIKEWSNNEYQYKLAVEALKALGVIE